MHWVPPTTHLTNVLCCRRDLPHSYCSAFDQIPTKSRGTKSQEKYSVSFTSSPYIYLVTLFDPKFQIFKSSQSWRFLAFLTWPLNIVNVARFARNVEWDFFYVIFKHCEMMSFLELNPSVSLHFMLYLLLQKRQSWQDMHCSAWNAMHRLLSFLMLLALRI